ncbi:hypothetical protein FJZ36_02215 [Candidatus Poribacteria bacterium]|nr:hypothetical protein [Candidatus Poribacteria bacterium]
MKRFAAATACALLIAMSLQGQVLRQELGDLEVGDHWIYNDLDAGIARAKQEGKPLFVVFRCVP